MKTCTKCRVEKPLSDFYRCRSFKDGLQLWCKSCNKNALETLRRARGIRPADTMKAERRAAAKSPMRGCTRCHLVKPREAFHRNRSTPSGYGNICRECRPAYDAILLARRNQDPERLARYRLRTARYMRDYRKLEEVQPRDAARKIVGLALKCGALIRKPCEMCGATKVQAHHDDYAKPLEVRWLCKEHHDAVHAAH